MSKRTIYKEPGYNLPQLPLGARVYVETQGLVPHADMRYGVVMQYDEGNVQVFLSEVKHGGRATRAACYVWLYPSDIQAV